MRPKLEIHGSEIPAEIASAIKGFESEYHADFKSVRDEMKNHLKTMDDNSSNSLSLALRSSLLSWGAGRRGAPKVVNSFKLKEIVDSKNFQEAIFPFYYFINGGIKFEVNDEGQCLIDGSTTRLNEFANSFYNALNFVNNKILVGNTNVTYPMKALLLLTGAPLAFDSYVRDGLTQSGIVGFAATQYSFPSRLSDSGFKKILGMFFLVYDCWNCYEKVIKDGIEKTSSDYFEENQITPSRVFDILFFMKSPVLKSFNCGQGWFRRLKFG